MTHAANDETRPGGPDSGPIRPPETETGLPSTAVPEPSGDASPEEIETDIARTRRDLADTVGALSDKLDPKAQADKQVDELKARAHEQKARLQGQAEQARESALSSVAQARESARASAAQARDAATDDQGRPSPALWAAGGAAAGLLVATVSLLASRRR